MGERPFTVLSAAVSLDGRLDDAGPDRLLLSNSEDFDRVDAERAAADAILVGAATIRADDPRLLVRSPERRSAREREGRPANPTKVAVAGDGDLDPRSRFFTAGPAERLVYSAASSAPRFHSALDGAAEVVDAGERLALGAVLSDLSRRGVRRLLVEGGGRIHTGFVAAGLFDELQLAVAPFFVGQPGAPRLFGEAEYPYGPDNPLRLLEARPIGDLVLLRYGAPGA